MYECDFLKYVDVAGKKWTFPLMQEIMLHGNKGFNTIFHRLRKISPKVLSSRLKEMEKMGLVEKKKVANLKPAKSMYSMSKKGIELYEILNSFRGWSEKYHSNPGCTEKECIMCEKY